MKKNNNYTFFEDLEINKQLDLKLVDKQKDTKDSFIFKFEQKQNHDQLGGIVPSQVRLSAQINDENVVRPYTIISSKNDTQYILISIKVYEKTEEYPEGGVFGQYLQQLELGSSVKFMFKPVWKFQYFQNGQFIFNDIQNNIQTQKNYSQINFVCGGSGITPAICILNQIAYEIQNANLNSPITIKVIYANKTKKHIMLHQILEDLLKITKGNVFYIFSEQQQDSQFKENEMTGRISKQIFEQYLSPASEECINIYCGPAPMNQNINKYLKELEHKEYNIKQF